MQTQPKQFDPKAIGRFAIRFFRAFGIDPLQTILALKGVSRYCRMARIYRSRQSGTRFKLTARHIYPCLTDHHDNAASLDPHYFHQDLWAARKIFEKRPVKHIDVGSRIDGLVAHLLSFMDVTVVDYRPLDSHISGLTFVQSDAIDLHQLADNSVHSLTSLHAIEHFGLGRYGDPIDPDAPFKCMRALERVLCEGGRLYIGIPIGRERLEYNAHRVFAPRTVIEGFRHLTLLSFAAIDDSGFFHENAQPDSFSSMRYACGLFEFTKALDPNRNPGQERRPDVRG